MSSPDIRVAILHDTQPSYHTLMQSAGIGLLVSKGSYKMKFWPMMPNLTRRSDSLGREYESWNGNWYMIWGPGVNYPTPLWRMLNET